MSKKKREKQKPEDAGDNYVDNDELLREVIGWKADCESAELEGKPAPQVPESIGEKIILIAEGMARRNNFSGYTYRDEMVLDGIENCIRYGHNFDPDKSSSPFAYFSQIIYYAFLRRIAIEKKQAHIKKKCIELAIDDPRYHHDLGDMGTSSEALFHIQQKLSGETSEYEKSITEQSKNKSSSKKKKKGNKQSSSSSSSCVSLFD